jgi:hypothetical protein
LGTLQMRATLRPDRHDVGVADTGTGDGDHSWVVWRQDDNGNRFEVGRFPSQEAAEALASEMEARGHRQMYWVATAD